MGNEFAEKTRPDDEEKQHPTSRKLVPNLLQSGVARRDNFDRRSFLKVAGATIVGASGLAAGTAGAVTTRHGISFDRTVNAVDDLGLDPSGNEPIDSGLESALETGTLVEFPPGEYLVSSNHSTSSVARFGIRGTGKSRRDVQFLPPNGKGVKMFSGGGPGPLLMENFSINERMGGEDGLSMGLSCGAGLKMLDVEWLGQTPLDSVLPTTYQLSTAVYNQDGVAVLENVVAGADAGAVPANYPEGVEFLYAGPSHNGELIMRDCHVEERNSNGTRVSNCDGVITVEGGKFINNQNAGIRFVPGRHPSKVSTVDGAYLEVDGSRNSADGIRLDSDSTVMSGSVIKNLEAVWSRDSGRGVIAAPSWAGHGGFTMQNCVIRNEGANVATINAEDVGGGSDTNVVVENCSFTGSGGGLKAINRSGSVIRDSCFSMSNGDISGFDEQNLSLDSCRVPDDGSQNAQPTADITLVDKTGLDLTLSGANSSDADGSSITYSWEVEESSYSGMEVSHTFADAGTYTVSLTVEDDVGATDTASTDLTVYSGNRLKIRGGGDPTNYDFTVDGSLQPVADTIERWDDVTDTGATGWVTTPEDIDRFIFDGDIEEFQFLEGVADVFVNGEKVTPEMFNLPNKIVIDGRAVEGTTSYSFTVTGDIVNDPLLGATEAGDSIDTHRVSGLVQGGVDAYRFSGDLNALSMDGAAQVSLEDNDG